MAMRCEQAEQWFPLYRDLPEDAEERLALEEHVAGCDFCAEQFRQWEESAELIREAPARESAQDDHLSADWVSQNVMSRIYADQSWRLPAARRSYSFSGAFRRRVSGLLAALLAIFVTGFLYTAVDRSIEPGSRSGVMETASAFALSHGTGGGVHLDVPVASLSDPILLTVSPAMPEYWVALSMLGTIMTLLILNWFTRVRA